ncbi:S41 family peptidase [Corallococcus silvisoli]|uniref:S41 family peptidase n=1 Tax=Corallococcus silvisoli TaxID=2697031 RepID=UPI00137838AC|nr:S41 family peptidase [Corallococcus silvisoli]NBD12563.1 hypothetical protein [Corallococcus silvisoli]
MSRYPAVLALALLCLSLACGKDEPDGGGKPSPDDTLEGSWRTDGYGLAIRFQGTKVELFEITSTSCLPWISGELVDGTLPEADLHFRVADHRLLIEDPGTLHVTGQSAPLPEDCSKPVSQPNDPVLNFEIFWRTFAEQYALFDLYGVDWQARYAQFRSRVTPTTTDIELFTLLSEMLAPLTDGHIRLVAGEEVFNPKSLPADFEEHFSDIGPYVLSHYLGGPGVTTAAENRVAWQSLNERVGYIFLGRMEKFSTDPEAGVAAEVAAAGQALDTALAALSTKQALILDVRFNPGGHDAVALALAGRFTDVERTGFYKKTRTPTGFTPQREFRFAPSGPRQFTRPVYLLTSGVTASAAENFTLAMRGLPNVTVIGERTMGALSDVPTRHLPNGWEFGLSVELYTAPDHQIYERVGIPPSVEVPFDGAGFGQGTDRIFQAALERANAGG